MNYDRLYSDPARPTQDGPDIVGPLSRADNRGGAIRYIEYFGTLSIAHNTTVTFRPSYTDIIGPPDWWVFYLMANDGGARATLTEENNPPSLVFNLNQNVTVTPGFPIRPVLLSLPGRGRSIDILAGGGGGNGLTMQTAACWGYNPRDVFN